MRILTSSDFKKIAGGLMKAPGGGDDGGGGYCEDLPPIDFSIDPIDFGGFNVSFTFDPVVSKMESNITVDSDYVQTPVLNSDVASAIGNAAASACGVYAKRVGGAMACAGLGSAVSTALTNWRASRSDIQQFNKGMEYNMKWGMLP